MNRPPSHPPKRPSRTPDTPARSGGKPAARGPGKPAAKPASERIAGVARDRLLWGVHPVAAAWTNPERRCQRLLVTEGGLAALDDAVRRARDSGLERPEPTLVDKAALDRLLPQAVHQGVVLEAAPLPEVGIEDVCVAADSDPRALVVVLDQVTDPHNVGAILRSAAAFGAAAVIVTERHAPETTAVLAKSASGALEVVPLVRVGNLARALTELQQAGFHCVGLAESGERTLADLDLGGRTALVLGAEGKGLRQLTKERCDVLARLPTGGPIGSLNVSNAAAVALYEAVRARP